MHVKRIDNGGLEYICAPSFACSLISWLFINQSRRTIYQIEAEYISYCMALIILLLVKELTNYVLKSTKVFIFSHHVDSSTKIEIRLLKSFVVIIYMIMERTVCKTFFLIFRPLMFYVASKMMLTHFRECFPFF